MNQVSIANSFGANTALRPDFQQLAAAQNSPEPNEESLEVREAFQDFVAGTLFKEMFKSMRRMHGEPAYFHGGQAEKMFQSQMDQQVAEDLARTDGAQFSDALFDAFQRRR